MNSSYEVRFMRLMVFFDLPTATKKDRKEYSLFRKFLIKNGFMMMQFSVYVRICNGIDAVAKHRARVEAEVPQNGSVRVLVVTDKQFASMDILTGSYIIADISASDAQIGFF